jgi:radical SAM protein with 4Fe4S-binding SPASM domain
MPWRRDASLLQTMIDLTRRLCKIRQPVSAQLELATARRPPPAIVFNGVYGGLAGTFTPAEVSSLLRDLRTFGVTNLQFEIDETQAGADLLQVAVEAGILGFLPTLVVLDTLTGEAAAKIADLGFVDVDLWFGQHTESLRCIRRIKRAHGKAGLRVALTSRTIAELDQIFALVESERVMFTRFYHSDSNLDTCARRRSVDSLFWHTRALGERFDVRDVFTDSPIDAAYAWLTLDRERSPLAYRAYRLLQRSAQEAEPEELEIDRFGNVRLLALDVIVDNVRARPLSEISQDGKNVTLAKVRGRRQRVTGRCRGCRFLQPCGGGSVARAYAATGDLFASDPAAILQTRRAQARPTRFFVVSV